MNSNDITVSQKLKKLKQELQMILSVMNEAYQLFHDQINKGLQTKYKAVDDPVTILDLLIDEFLKRKLLTLFPDYGWLSEETKDDIKRLEKKQVFIVDPIDGTRELILGLPEYAISVALVEDNYPTIGVVLNPATGEIYHAIKGFGAFLNGKQITTRPHSENKPIIIVSRSDEKKGKFEFLKNKAEIMPVGSSAYKLSRLAKGDADAALTFHPMHEWDIAAGLLIAEEAGAIVTSVDGKSFTFNRSINTKIDSFLAVTKEKEKEIKQLLKYKKEN
ncbi:MAG: 3'(2'),5'-bisphosphate nucleotidase CysQ [Candidatus Heimdallarchaeaceae archaeon]